jgi:hypothetical protein
MTGGRRRATMGTYCYSDCNCSYCYCYSLALYSLGWTPLCLYHLRLDHPGLKRTETAPRGASPPMGLGPFQRLHPQVMPPTLSPNQKFLFILWSFTMQALPQDA